jgi:hypothetical protein
MALAPELEPSAHDDVTHGRSNLMQLLSIGRSRVRHGEDTDGRPLCERGKWAQTPAKVKPAGQGQPTCELGLRVLDGRWENRAGKRR